MALSDPQSVTIGASTISLPRTSSGLNTGTFTSADGNVQVVITHVLGKRNRRQIRINHRKVAADPMVAAQNLQYSMSCIVSVDTPPVGYTPAEQKEVLDGLFGILTASSGANEVKLLGGES